MQNNEKKFQLINETRIANQAAVQVLKTIVTVLDELNDDQRYNVASRYAGKAILQCRSLQKHLQKADIIQHEIWKEHDENQAKEHP